MFSANRGLHSLTVKQALAAEAQEKGETEPRLWKANGLTRTSVIDLLILDNHQGDVRGNMYSKTQYS